ncbi:MAG: hypothetical protein ACJAYE_001796 [Candidatus Azotimanducaceae bacterium]|jgi:hypothetical protein
MTKDKKRLPQFENQDNVVKKQATREKAKSSKNVWVVSAIYHKFTPTTSFEARSYSVPLL